MKLENNKRDFITDSNEETIKMSISSDVQGHIIKLVTEHTYTDPLGSALRECVSNAVDSVTEAGTKEPVLVKIEKNKASQNELSIQDFGLGLDDVNFKKYIMGIGESTKRNSDVLLGGYGAGAKAWLAYTDNFTYVCRKDGIERKYLIFKGEEFPECTLVYENPTTEKNGVTVIVILKNNYDEVSRCSDKIREQLAYLDNVYYNISTFDNNYKVYRNDLFQFSTMSLNSEMHISLKNIRYPIDWRKIGISSIDIPVGLRFDDYEDIKPIFNRESIQYNGKSIKAIVNKIKEVADWFVSEYNKNVVEETSFRKIYSIISSKDIVFNLFNKDFNINGLINISSISVTKPKMEGLVYKDFEYYYKLADTILNYWEPIAYDRGRLEKSQLNYGFKHSCLYNSYWKEKTTVVLVDYALTGNIREFLRQKHGRFTYYVTKKPLDSVNRRLFIDDAHFEEFKYVVNNVENEFIDETKTKSSEIFLDWVKDRKEQIKNSKIPIKGAHVVLNKQAGEITIFKGRKAQKGDKSIYEKSKIAISALNDFRGLTVYCSIEEEFNKNWVLNFPKVRFLKFNTKEIKHVTKLKHFITKEQFMKSKTFARIATAQLIRNLLESNPINKHDNLLEEMFKSYADLRKRLVDYRNENYHSISPDIGNAIIEEARESNNWDMNIYADVVEYEKIVKKFGFITVIERPSEYDNNLIKREITKNLIYVMLKYQKITGTRMDEFELVKKEQALQEAANESALSAAVA